MAGIQGICDDRFDAVRRELQQNVDSGEELGASIVLDLDGEIAIDLWGGYARLRPHQAVGIATPSRTSGRPPRP